LAACQDRVFSRKQLLGAGVSATAIRDRVRAGLFVVVFRGVYSLGAPSPRGRIRAAVLAAGDGAVLSHRAAAWMHELVRGPPTTVDITTTRRAESRPGINVHRVRGLPGKEICVVDGIPCTTVARTLLDLAATEPRRVVERAIEEAELRRTYDGIPIEAAMRHGRPGVAELRAVIEEHAPGTTITRNDLEEAFLALCRRGGIEQPLMNQSLVLPSGRHIDVDALWPRQRVAMELDGRSVHLRRRNFERDRERDIELLVAGYSPGRFTWLQITRKADWVAANVRQLTRRCRERPGRWDRAHRR
jgi:hypothetical protein